MYTKEKKIYKYTFPLLHLEGYFKSYTIHTVFDFFSEDTRRKTHRKSTENGVSIEEHLDYIHKVYLLFGRTVI